MANKFVIYTDGGSRNNPGPAAIGAVIYNNKGIILKEYSKYLGQATNNEAEYQAVIFALKKIKSLIGKQKSKKSFIEIRSDSELLVKQMRGEYKVIHPKIQPLFLSVWNLKIDFGKVEFTSIPREKNKIADALVNKALDSVSNNLFENK